MVGQTISHYKVTAEVGRGWMGVVYKAEDTSLDRPVALKFLAAHLVEDTEIRKRFEREAKAAAALNHPNVCTVHEIAEADGRTFIAMAFLEGEPLEKKIEAGPLKLKDALDIAIQTAKGLQAAHGKKIVHRDIKPANLMIGEDRHVTIMDFGLALLTDRSKLTRLDETMGTVTYMSPEQTYGMELDHRTDVWSLGVVIYEMVTGQRPFKGHYDQAVTYSITNEEPEPMTGLRTGIPMELEILVNKCLAKETEERYQHTDELLLDLQGLRKKIESGRSTIFKAQVPSQTAATQSTSPAQPADNPLVKYRVIENLAEQGDSIKYLAEDTELHRSVAIRVLPQSSAEQIERVQRRKQGLVLTAGALGVFFGLVFAFLWLSSTDTVAEAPLRRFAFAPESLFELSGFRAVISPNGRHIVYVAGGEESKLWVRDLDREEPRELAGTAGARRPFWSPDSQFIGFFANQELKKISLQGGPAITLCALPSRIFSGGSWRPDGNFIAFGVGGPPKIYEVPARGGEPQLLFDPERSEKGVANSRPHFLPLQAGARSIVFVVSSRTEGDIAVKNLETGEWELLAEGAFPVYSPSGHIVYQTDRYESGLWALPFSLETLKPTGEAFPIAENVGEPSVAADGTLVSVDLFDAGQQQLVWLDRDGIRLGAIGRPQADMRHPVLSPDGRRVAVRSVEDTNMDVWVHEVDRAMRRRLTFDPARDGRSQWAPSGKEITFQSLRRSDNFDIFSRSADGTGEPVLLVGTDLAERPYDWSSDGKYLLYTVADPENQSDLWYLKRKEDGSGFESVAFLQTSFHETVPQVSPDGRFVAYCSDEAGSYEVYVRPFPDGEGKWQVSTNGGWQPRWSSDGKELFYVEQDTLIAVAVTMTPSFLPGTTTPLFQDLSLVGLSADALNYDVAADGQRFVVVDDVVSEEAKPSIHVVQNWYAEFRNRDQD